MSTANSSRRQKIQSQWIAGYFEAHQAINYVLTTVVNILSAFNADLPLHLSLYKSVDINGRTELPTSSGWNPLAQAKLIDSLVVDVFSHMMNCCSKTVWVVMVLILCFHCGVLVGAFSSPLYHQPLALLCLLLLWFTSLISESSFYHHSDIYSYQ